MLTLNDGILGMAALKPKPKPAMPPVSTGSRLRQAAAGFRDFSALPGSTTSADEA